MGVILPVSRACVPLDEEHTCPAGLWCLSLDSLLPAKKVHQMGVEARHGAKPGAFLLCLCFVERMFLLCTCFVFCRMSVSLWEMPYFAFLFPRGTLWGTVPWCLCWRTRQALVLGSETLWDKEGWTPTVQPDSCYLIGNPGDTFHCFPQQPQWKKHSVKKKVSLFFPALWTDVCFRHCLIVLLKNRHWFFWLFPDIIISVFRTFSPSVSVILENDLANRAMKMH